VKFEITKDELSKEDYVKTFIRDEVGKILCQNMMINIYLCCNVTIYKIGM